MLLDISFKNKKIEKTFNEGAQLEKIHGSSRAKKIRVRMKALRDAKTLMDFWPPKTGPERCHELTQGRRKGQLSVDLDQPYRLIFTPGHDPPPISAGGGLDWSKVTAIIILGVEDTHDTHK
jgi:proteic killer suppression protein